MVMVVVEYGGGGRRRRREEEGVEQVVVQEEEEEEEEEKKIAGERLLATLMCLHTISVGGWEGCEPRNKCQTVLNSI